MARARQEVAIADRMLQAGADPGPAGWAELTGQAAALRNAAQRLAMACTAIDRLMAGQSAQHSGNMGTDPAQRGRELSERAAGPPGVCCRRC
jgi:hypothetical protein